MSSKPINETLTDDERRYRQFQVDMVPLVMAARIGRLEGWWLECRCACGAGRALPLRLLSGNVGADRPLSQVLPRLVCPLCGARPVMILLAETPITKPCGGAPPGWTIPLLDNE